MTGTEQARTRASSTFNTAVSASGLALGAVSVLSLLVTSQAPRPVYLLCVPLIVLMAWFPMLIGRTSGGIEVGFDSCILIFLALTVSMVEAEVIWSLGVVFAQLSADKRKWVKFFNSGLGILAGAAALVVIDAAGGTTANANSPRVLLAAALGAAAYFVVDFGLSAISVSLDEGTSLWQELASPGSVTALGVFLAIDSIGYRAADIVQQEPWWSAALLSVPLTTILVAARARSRGAEHARRLDIMFRTAVRVQALGHQQEVLSALRDSSRELFRDSRVELRPRRPESDEVGTRVQGSAEEVWVVGPARNRARSTAADDQQALDALVAVTDEALSRLVLIDEMDYLARHDALTGLGNRTLFVDRVEHTLTRHRRRGGQLAVLFCDLDGFKRVNDCHGHAAGDELLIEVAQRIRGSIRDEDTVARLSGDEFAVLMESVNSSDEVAVVCERILESVRRPIIVAGQQLFVTATIGVAVSAGHESAELLLSNADMAMYYGKSGGKDRFENYEVSLGDERVQRLDLIEALRRAVDNRELEVHYQPTVDLATGAMHGVEALARWQHNGEYVSPEVFIPIAEETGLIVRLGDLVLDLVTVDAPKLRAAAGRDFDIGINVSAQQLKLPDFVDKVCRARSQMGDVNVILEVTEHDFVSDDPGTLTAMTVLAAEGIRFAVDDFGTGFSSIGYLRRLPVHIVKIDKSFVTHIDLDPTACSLVQSMATMMNRLGLDVVVEGVERESQREHLTDHSGATIGQGYLFGRPQRSEEIVKALASDHAPPSMSASTSVSGHRDTDVVTLDPAC